MARHATGVQDRATRTAAIGDAGPILPHDRNRSVKWVVFTLPLPPPLVPINRSSP